MECCVELNELERRAKALKKKFQAQNKMNNQNMSTEERQKNKEVFDSETNETQTNIEMLEKVAYLIHTCTHNYIS